MRKYTDHILIGLYLFLVLVILGGLSGVPKPNILKMFAQNGVCDARYVDFETSVIELDRTQSWDSFPEKFYTPDNIPADGATYLTQKDYERINYATHRIGLVLTTGYTYGIWMKTCDYSMRLFINGKEIDSVGTPGISKETTVSRTDTKSYYFVPPDSRTEIIVQTANFVHNDGCQPPVIFIGTAENITRHVKSDALFSYVIIGCLLTAGLYHLAIFILNRDRITVFLFALCCFLMLIDTNKLIQLFFPQYNWQIAFQIEYLAHFATFATVTLFLECMFPALIHRAVVRPYYMISGCFATITFIFDSVVYSGLLKYYYVCSCAMILYLISRLASGLREGKLQNYIGFFGMFLIALFSLNDILYHSNIRFLGPILGQTYTAPVGMVFFVFCYGAVISLEHAQTVSAYTEARINERALAADNLALDRLYRMKNEMIATVSHETRTPLAVLSGYAELISMEMRRKGVDLQTADDLDQIADEAQRIAEIMDNMQLLSNKRGMLSRKDPTQIKQVVQAAARLYRPILARKNIDLILEIQEDLPPVWANADMLTQVLFNLLQNARNYAENGEVTIAAKQRIEDEVQVSVSDTGKGIPADLLPYIFDRGFSAEKDSGGLGLSICKEIIETHGGILEAQSNPGEGTTVRFTLLVWEEEKHGLAQDNIIDR